MEQETTLPKIERSTDAVAASAAILSAVADGSLNVVAF
jgi:hypothetical protein